MICFFVCSIYKLFKKDNETFKGSKSLFSIDLGYL